MVTDLHDSAELGPTVIDIGEKVQAYPAQPLFAQLPHHRLSFRTQNRSETVCDGS